MDTESILTLKEHWNKNVNDCLYHISKIIKVRLDNTCNSIKLKGLMEEYQGNFFKSLHSNIFK